MKILITGGDGMLSKKLTKDFSAEHEVFAPGRVDLDICSRENVADVINKFCPELIIHAAAYTNVEECEKQVDLCYQINLIGTQNLVEASVNKKIKFVYISSTGCYGTFKKDEAYSELDFPEPTTVHHKSKYLGEEFVKAHLNDHLILRTGWIFGGEKDDAKNFVYKRFLESKGKSEMFSDTSQIGNPTSISDFSAQISVLIREKCLGVFNCVNSGSASRFEYVQKIIKLFKSDCEVKQAPVGMYKRVAPVSNNESAINYKLELMGLNVMPSWECALENYINSLID